MDIKDNISNGNGFDNGYENGVNSAKTESKAEMNGTVIFPLIDRHFTLYGKDPFRFDIYGNQIQWISEEVKVTDDSGKIIFVQPNVRRPSFWSPLALKVVASKYFWGDQAKAQRESSPEQIIGRVSRWFERQALKQKYLSEGEAIILHDEIASICLNQLCVFNSPVWFNVGIQEYDKNAGGVAAYVWDAESDIVIRTNKTMDRPQCSACFIQSIEDNIESILAVQIAEAILFKAGSGTGTNRSPLRSSKEKLTGGGKPSGPVSFMKGYDTYAGVIKSGGKTRRAAKMEILNVDHPDIIDFVEAKSKEEKKAWALIEQGYSGGMNGEAYGSVAFQNCNMSVRASDGFMEAIINDEEWKTKAVTTGEVIDTFRAREIIRKIAEGTYICGDPGMQFDTVINKYNTCKNSGRINATNPCSEYVFLDDTACNLASINLIKFLTEDGKFDVEKFRKVVKYFAVAMDVIVDGASYPTEKICRNSRDFRPLGLGYANLGALLMCLGLPYDSDSGRAVAAAITAIMCGEAYKVSAELARLVGAFPAFNKNRESMIDVIEMHRNHVKDIEVNKMPADLRYLVNDAWDSWSAALEIGKIYGFRNSQMSVLAPTGTISFMMDCDTTGIEPDIALVKYKVLAGGGMLKIVNKSVGLALRTLGYNHLEINDIIQYIEKNDMIEGSPHLKEEHLAVFDCAFKPAKGKRFIHHRAHIKMMGVAQPFISGAISKTINMPEHSTVDEIVDAYIFAWEQRLKAVAIYRENSKKSQPLNTQKTEGEMVNRRLVKATDKSERIKPPQTRKSIIHKFNIAGNEGYLMVGLYENGKPCDLFVMIHKTGSTIRGLLDAWAMSVSMNLQYGTPVDDLFKKFRYQKFEPAGFVKTEIEGDIDKKMQKIRMATSIVDYVAQFMLNNFGEGAGKISVEIPHLENLNDGQTELTDFNNRDLSDGNDKKVYAGDGITCPLCGGAAKRTGNCEILCTSCMQITRSGCGQ